MNLLRAVLVVSIVYQLSGCDAHPGLEPAIAQEISIARIDPDTGLARKVEKALGNESGAVSYGIEVTATGGKVELWGTVDSTAARKRVELTAAGVVGVKAIESHLQVDPGA